MPKLMDEKVLAAAGRPAGYEFDIEGIEVRDKVGRSRVEFLKVADISRTCLNNLVGVYSAAGTPRIQTRTIREGFWYISASRQPMLTHLSPTTEMTSMGIPRGVRHEEKGGRGTFLATSRPGGKWGSRVKSSFDRLQRSRANTVFPLTFNSCPRHMPFTDTHECLLHSFCVYAMRLDARCE